MSLSLTRTRAALLAFALALTAPQAVWAADAPPPAGSKLAKVTVGMPEAQVQDLLGSPTSTVSYPTWKVYMPWNWGGGGSRVEYKYKGQGRVVFETKQWTGALRVVRVLYDPSEDGY